MLRPALIESTKLLANMKLLENKGGGRRLSEKEDFLSSLCYKIHRAETRAQEEEMHEQFGDDFPIQLMVLRMDKVKVEIRKESVNHHEPHMHVAHSDLYDVSLSLGDFRVLAGKIRPKSLKFLRGVLVPLKEKLNAIWVELNEKDNSIGAERLINNLLG